MPIVDENTFERGIMPNPLYHQTYTKFVDSIMRNGLKPGTTFNIIWMSEKPWTSSRSEVVVLKIDTSYLDKGKLKKHSVGGDWWTYAGEIPSSAIERIS